MEKSKICGTIGSYHTFLFVRKTPKNGESWAWTFGGNEHGQLGIGDKRDRNTPTKLTPPNNKRIKDIVCGCWHTHFLTSDGLLFSTGDNRDGKLGIGIDYKTTPNVSSPVLVEFPDKKKIKMVFCSHSSDHTFILSTDGLWFCFGRNFYGELGIGIKLSQNSPVLFTPPTSEKIISIATGSYHTLFLTETQKVYSCGSNSYGQLSSGSTKDELKPVLCCFESKKKIIKICSGGVHSLFLSSDFDVLSCGHWLNDFSGNKNERYVSNAKVIKSLSNKKVINIDCGSYHSVFYTGDGNIFVSGWNVCGNLGLNNNKNSILVPTRVNFHTKIVQFCCGRNHSVILTEDNFVYSCGRNDNGRLGIGKTVKEVEKVNKFTKVDLKWGVDLGQRNERWEYLFGCK